MALCLRGPLCARKAGQPRRAHLRQSPSSAGKDGGFSAAPCRWAARPARVRHGGPPLRRSGHRAGLATPGARGRARRAV